MLHLGIDTPTQNNIFKVRRKAMLLTLRGDQSPFHGLSLDLGLYCHEHLGLQALLYHIQGAGYHSGLGHKTVTYHVVL